MRGMTKDLARARITNRTSDLKRANLETVEDAQVNGSIIKSY